MGVELVATGEYKARGGLFRTQKPDKWLADVAQSVVERCDGILIGHDVFQDQQGINSLELILHPAAEGAWLYCPAPGKVGFRSKTSSVGPGYHLYLMDLLQWLEDAHGVRWSDRMPDDARGLDFNLQTTPIGEGLDAEILDVHLRGLKHVMDLAQQGDIVQIKLSLPTTHLFECDDVVMTPLGPRTTQWLRAVEQNPNVAWDMIPWKKRDIDAEFYLNRALCVMWTEVRWKPPETNEESDRCARVLGDLYRAWERDPNLDYPWAEWGELLQCMGVSERFPLAAENAKKLDLAPEIGYRRKPVRVFMDSGWSVNIPGDFSEDWSDPKTWTGWDGSRTIHFSTISFGPIAEDKVRELLKSTLERVLAPGERVTHKTDQWTGTATIHQADEQGRRFMRLGAVLGARTGYAVLTISFDDPSDRDWAIQTWHSVKYQPPEFHTI